MNISLDDTSLTSIFEKLKEANDQSDSDFSGRNFRRQPVHTVYGGAHLFKSNTVSKIGNLAQKNLMTYAPSFDVLKDALGMKCSDSLAEQIYDRIVDKLKTGPVEDFRIDFEDGLGIRTSEEEDQIAIRGARELYQGFVDQTLSPFIGIRIKNFSEPTKVRSIRTLDLFMTEFCSLSGGKLPNNFVVTLPKVQNQGQLSALADIFDLLEKKANIDPGSLKLEFMVEVPETLMDSSGKITLRDFVTAARDRCIGAHFGTYDYTAALDISAKDQSIDHWSCDFARNLMKLSLSKTGIFLSDGATHSLPIGPFKGELNEQKFQKKPKSSSCWLEIAL